MTTETIQIPAGIIFDWDGTLVDTIPGLRLAHNHVRTSLGYPDWTEEEFYANLKYSSLEIYPKIYGDRSPDALKILYDFIGENHLKYLSVLPDAAALLDFLGENEIPHAIVSNKRHEYLLKEISHLEWLPRFFCALGAGKAAKDKPAADPVIMALNMAMSPLEPAKTWFVGDTVTDLLAARAAGCPAVLITHGADRTSLINEYKPYIVADDCAHLRDILARAIHSDNKKKAC